MMIVWGGFIFTAMPWKVINSVAIEQYLKRTYEFGIYKALGRSRKGVKLKVAAEVLSMNFIACLILIIFTLLLSKEGLMSKADIMEF